MNSNTPSRKNTNGFRKGFREQRKANPFQLVLWSQQSSDLIKTSQETYKNTFSQADTEVFNKTLGSPVQPFTKRTLYHVQVEFIPLTQRLVLFQSLSEGIQRWKGSRNSRLMNDMVIQESRVFGEHYGSSQPFPRTRYVFSIRLFWCCILIINHDPVSKVFLWVLVNHSSKFNQKPTVSAVVILQIYSQSEGQVTTWLKFGISSVGERGSLLGLSP